MRGRTIGNIGRIAVLVAIIGMAALTGCTDTSRGSATRASGEVAKVPDVSAAGRLDYACALAIDAKTNHGPVDTWNIAVGDEADPVLHEVAGASGLLGALMGAHVPHHRNLSEAAQKYYAGVVRLDTGDMQGGLDRLAQGCRNDSLPVHKPDISANGRITYACALATDVATNGGPAEGWLAIGDDAPAPSYELGGTVGLLGAMTNSHVAGHRAMSEAASDVLAATMRMDLKGVQQALDAVTAACGKR